MRTEDGASSCAPTASAAGFVNRSSRHLPLSCCHHTKPAPIAAEWISGRINWSVCRLMATRVVCRVRRLRGLCNACGVDSEGADWSAPAPPTGLPLTPTAHPPYLSVHIRTHPYTSVQNSRSKWHSAVRQPYHKPPAGGAHHHYPGRRQATHTPTQPIGGDIAPLMRVFPRRRRGRGLLSSTEPPSAGKARSSKRDRRPYFPERRSSPGVMPVMARITRER